MSSFTSLARIPRRSRPSAVVVASMFVLTSVAFAVPPTDCVVPDNGGTAALPPAGCAYVALGPLEMLNGLPPGEPVWWSDAVLSSFFNVVYQAGSVPGSEIQQFHATLAANLQGTGSSASLHRPAFFDVFCEMESAPRPPSTISQSFLTDLLQLQGQLPPGDPDFDLLRITAGTGFGMPSPGHTTLTAVGGGGGGAGGWAVDSFFDITYRIDFIGKPGGVLGGMSGSTTGTIRMQCGTGGTVATANDSWGNIKAQFR